MLRSGILVAGDRKVSAAGHEAVIYSFGASPNDALGPNAGLR
jgi:hypothetical protein